MTRNVTLRAAALAAIVGWPIGPAAQSSAPAVQADAVLQGGKIITLDARSTIAEAAAIRGGRFLAVGTRADVQGLVGPGTTVIDLEGRAVVPGLMDTHTHFRAAGQALYTVDMRSARTVEQALQAIQAFAAKKKPGEWIVGGAWHPPAQLAEKRYLTRQEIDRVAPDNPVYLPTVGHFVMGNSRALAAAGVTRTTPNPEGGTIERDPAGDATGVLSGPAIELLGKAVPDWTFDEIAGQYRESMRYLNSQGLTSTLDGGLGSRDVQVLRHLVDRGEATVRVGVMYRPLAAPGADVGGFEASLKGNGAASGFGDEWLRFAGAKIVLDGGMTLRTAHTRAPYPDDAHYHGQPYVTPPVFRQLAGIADRHGWRVGVHVVGDKAIDVALDAFEDLNRERPIAGKRFALIHASLIQRDQMERARQLGLRVELQNVFMWDKAATVQRFLGMPTASRAVPTKTLIDVMGIDSLGAGTDFPVNSINPFLNMYVMVSRRDPEGVVYGAGEAIGREEALRLYTTAAAHATFEERSKGSIEPGKLADLVVLSADPLTVAEPALKDIRALTTIVGGKVVYQAARP